eukprot:CAMPEP_0204826448 /NCGR_PEP_ID=MMETSP1346-20131115/4137_1 /ASSEMBLY_ACC=CAM_ASM_000771 /TAXON_ID=215587 /ORGANISM="Aplanochytrium stocchinoi, Strain GSBS06" /LENGTH=316 /DNA_ID=CAMNT_0051954481 /DNA_START=94 /DNA_END=1041 /DNA_ORIENTATION=-
MKELCKRWWKFSARSPFGQFGSILGLRLAEDGGSVEIINADRASATVYAKVPRWCVNQNTGNLKLDAAVALFDEISTYSGMCNWDKKGRPGVSVSLSAKRLGLQRLEPDDGIIVKTTYKKAGKTLGFLNVDIFHEKEPGKVMVRGQHVKFLPMGIGTSILTSHLRNYPGSPFVKGFMSVLATYPMHDVIRLGESLGHDVLNLEDVRTEPTETGSIVSTGNFELTKLYGNPIGNLHGGCSAMLSSLIAKHAAQKYLEKKDIELEQINVNLLSGIPTKKGAVTLSAKILEDFDDKDVALTEAVIKYRDSTAVDCLMVW